MDQFNQKTCALFGCNNPVKNWRISCCSRSHQQSYAAKKRYGTENKPNKTKKDLAPYYRQYAIEKQKRVKNATPKWANKEKIKEIYVKAHKLSECSRIPHEVDHIIPLTSKLVCGLHNEYNLRIVTQKENREKTNTFFIE